MRPRSTQPYGRTAKQELAALASGQQLVIMPIDTDRYGRTVAHVWNGSTHLNAEMVKRGAAWFYSEYASTAALYDVEQEARDAKRGLWALPLKDRVEPWVWRERAQRTGTEASRAGQIPVGVLNKKGEASWP